VRPPKAPAARATLLALAGALALAGSLAGCESSQEKAAALRKLFHGEKIDRQGLLIAHTSRYVKILESALLHDENGVAAVLVLRSDAPGTLRGVPIAITLRGPHGQTLFQNNAPGLEPALTSLSLLEPHRDSIWIDDQIPAGDYPATLQARVGEALPVSGPVPQIAIRGAHTVEDPANGPGVQGTLSNPSPLAQQSLVLFALARRGGRPVAAGRAILTNLAPHASAPFQAFFIGKPGRGSLQLQAPASTLE
jgi:hypothetical protein